MALIGGIIVVVCFSLIIALLGLVDRSTEVLGIARSAASVVQSTELDDRQKERALQKYAIRLFALFAIIVAISAVAIAASLLVAWLMEYAGLVSMRDVLDMTLSPLFLVAVVAVSIAAVFRSSWRCRGEAIKDFESQHSATDRALHGMVFASWPVQVGLSGLESSMQRERLDGIAYGRPAFITGLPRAGTTLLLELCVSTNEFASHTYGDMPFLLTPIYWSRLSGRFRKVDAPHERVHGDGIMVNEESPESFEELIWKGYWPSHYKKDRIIPWSDTQYEQFEQFFQEHMRKIVLVRQDDAGTAPVRYISKNNLNIARIRYLKSVLPDSIILVPFRSPLQHTSSLLRQHRNFLDIHKQDPFARQYMEDTGHFDFGENLRPVDFGRWLSADGQLDTESLEFWMRYWTSAYRYLVANAQGLVHFFSYDRFCHDPETGLASLAKALEIENADTLQCRADTIVSPSEYAVDHDRFPTDLLNMAETVHNKLLSLSVV